MFHLFRFSVSSIDAVGLLAMLAAILIRDAAYLLALVRGIPRVAPRR
jgi:hypothetical protein